MDFKQLINNIDDLHDELQHRAISAVNQSLTIRNWLFGFYIVEYEQHGNDHAEYGKKFLPSMAKELKKRDIRGLSERNLRYCRQFYLNYTHIGGVLKENSLPSSIWQTLSAKSFNPLQTADSESFGVSPDLLVKRLSYSHIIELLNLEESLKRAFYEIECVTGNWSVRELKRQIESLLYERTGLSVDKNKLLKITQDQAVELLPKDIIRDPYIFEFAGLQQQEVMTEMRLEKALLDNLQSFILELGNGFCFEARQKRITIDNEHHYVDLVFYHRVLKCHIIIDLKTRKFKHGDAGQMNFYLNYFKENQMTEGDSPPVGLVLCTKKGESTAKYATTGMDNQLFVSKYKASLPSEEELEAFISKRR